MNTFGVSSLGILTAACLGNDSGGLEGRCPLAISAGEGGGGFDGCGPQLGEGRGKTPPIALSNGERCNGGKSVAGPSRLVSVV